MFRTVDAKIPHIIRVPISGGCSAGNLIVVSSGTFAVAEDAPTAATVVGIAQETVDNGAICSVELVNQRLVAADYVGSSKTSLANADLGKVFDITDDQEVNLDDTTGGVFLVVGYDNDRKLAYGYFTQASLAI
jgi:hypothetical protein